MNTFDAWWDAAYGSNEIGRIAAQRAWAEWEKRRELDFPHCKVCGSSAWFCTVCAAPVAKEPVAPDMVLVPTTEMVSTLMNALNTKKRVESGCLITSTQAIDVINQILAEVAKE